MGLLFNCSTLHRTTQGRCWVKFTSTQEGIFSKNTARRDEITSKRARLEKMKKYSNLFTRYHLSQTRIIERNIAKRLLKVKVYRFVFNQF